MIKLLKLNNKNVSKNYLKWLKDYQVIRYTQQKFTKPDYKKLMSFLQKKKEKKNELFLGIFFNQEHIGNVRLGPIDKNHNTAYIGYMLGERKYWGKGIATKVVNMICEIGFQKYKLKKINAACMSLNKASKKILLNNNFQLEGSFKSQHAYKKKRYTEYYFGLLCKNFIKLDIND